MEFTKLQRQRAADEVYQALRQAIVGYHIKPGERLDVEELSGKFGVSLTPCGARCSSLLPRAWWRSALAAARL